MGSCFCLGLGDRRERGLMCGMALLFGVLLVLLMLSLPMHGQRLVLSEPLAGKIESGEEGMDVRLQYLLSFARAFEWPDLSRTDNFYVEVIGRATPFTESMGEALSGFTVAGRPIRVTHTPRWSERSSFHRPNIVYVQPSAHVYLPHIRNFFLGTPVLVVSESPDFREGWMASLISRRDGSGHWDVALNVENIESNAGLLVPNSYHKMSVVRVPRGGEEVASVVGTSPLGGKGLSEVLAHHRVELAERDEWILRQRDTIVEQREQLDSLRLENFYHRLNRVPLVVYASADLEIAAESGENHETDIHSVVDLGEGAVGGRERGVVSGEVGVASGGRGGASDERGDEGDESHRTYPWADSWKGLALFLFMSVLSLASVLYVTSILVSASSTGSLLGQGTGVGKGSAVGAGDAVESAGAEVSAATLGSGVVFVRERRRDEEEEQVAGVKEDENVGGKEGAAGEPRGDIEGTIEGEESRRRGVAGAEHDLSSSGRDRRKELYAYSQQLELRMASSAHDREALRQIAQGSQLLKHALLSNISHEIRTPLNAIVSLSQFVAETASSDDAVKKSMELINQNAFDLVRLMNNIISLAQLETGELSLEESVCPVDEVLQAIYRVGVQHISARGRGEELRMQCVSSAQGVESVRIDREKVIGILEQLLIDSISSSRGAGVIGYGYRRLGDTSVEFFVCDMSLDHSIYDCRSGGDGSSWENQMALDVIEGFLGLMGSMLEEDHYGGSRTLSFTLLAERVV